MKVTIIGAAGVQAQGVIRDLATSPEVEEIVLADLEKARAVLEERSKAWGENKSKVAIVDVNDAKNLRNVIGGSTVVANCTSHVFNLKIMSACYDEGCHYTDLGGLFHWYRKQVKEHQSSKSDRNSPNATPHMSNDRGQKQHERQQQQRRFRMRHHQK